MMEVFAFIYGLALLGLFVFFSLVGFFYAWDSVIGFFKRRKRRRA